MFVQSARGARKTLSTMRLKIGSKSSQLTWRDIVQVLSRPDVIGTAQESVVRKAYRERVLSAIFNRVEVEAEGVADVGELRRCEDVWVCSGCMDVRVSMPLHGMWIAHICCVGVRPGWVNTCLPYRGIGVRFVAVTFKPWPSSIPARSQATGQVMTALLS